MTEPVRHLIVVLGDQLDPAGAALEGVDLHRDRVWMAEVPEEATHVWSHKARITLFLAAMRHFRDALRGRGIRVEYRALGEHVFATLADALAADVARLQPQRLLTAEPGDFRVREALRAVAQRLGVPLEIRPDRHFLCSSGDFAAWAAGRRTVRLEHFYRWLRARTGILMDGRAPCGGRWNFDAENRAGFDSAGPGQVPAPAAFPPDPVTRAVLAEVETRYPDHPGSLARFDWPVTPADAEQALKDFVAHRLPLFGRYQDAMWTGEPWLYHSRLSAALNLTGS